MARWRELRSYCCAAFPKSDTTFEVEKKHLADRIEGEMDRRVLRGFERCAVKPGDTAAILSKRVPRAHVHLAELALLRMGARRSCHRANAAQPVKSCRSLRPGERGHSAVGASRTALQQAASWWIAPSED